jgi:CBS domain-containing protein
MYRLSVPRLNYSCAASGEILRAYQQLNSPLGNFTSSRLLTVNPDTPLSSVLAAMERRDSDVSVVVSPDNKLVGIRMAIL